MRYVTPPRENLNGTEEVNSIVIDNLPLAHFFARKCKVPFIAYEDKVAEATLGLFRAAQLFDKSLGYKFSSYACFWIKERLQQAINRERKHFEGNSLSVHDEDFIKLHSADGWNTYSLNPLVYLLAEERLRIKVKERTYRKTLKEKKLSKVVNSG